MSFERYSFQEIEKILEDLKTDKERGLSFEEVKKREKAFGLNEIRTKKITSFSLFLKQFRSSFVYLLILASFFAFFIKEREEAFFILFFVLINVFLGFYQELKAQKSLELLKRYLVRKIRVKREGKELLIEDKFLVPGDLVILEQGNIVPADIRLVKTENFFVDEEILTGESAPVAKNEKTLSFLPSDIFQAQNIAFSGTSVVSGRAEGIVFDTGKNTFLGKMVDVLIPEKRSIFEQRIFDFSKKVLKITIFSICFFFLLFLIFKKNFNLFEILIFCITLIVAIIPEPLPTVCSFALSLSALKLVKKKVVVRRISSLEDFGNIEVLCADKTGTLTQNSLVLDKIFSQEEEKTLFYALLLGERKEDFSFLDPFDIAIFKKMSDFLIKEIFTFKKIKGIPFDSERMRASGLFEGNGKMVLIVKGAPEIILERCQNLEESKKKEIRDFFEKESLEGKRVLAVAFKEWKEFDYSLEDEKDLNFLGLLSFEDPLKPKVERVISLAKKFGLEIKILTGDAPFVAQAVGEKIGLIKKGEKVWTGQELEKLSPEEFERVCQEFRIFARLNPVMKLKILDCLQKKFKVGFLGEGINDLPSLKKADVSLVVNSAPDISRENSDIILLEKDLGVIIRGIKEGRKIFANVNKYLKCTLSSNFGNFYSTAIFSLFLPFFPVLPLQILLVNILTDFPLLAIAFDRVSSKELKKPEAYQLNRFVFLIFFLALISSLFDFLFFFFFSKKESHLFQPLWVLMSILTEIFLIFSVRTERIFFKAPKPSFILFFLSIFVISFAFLFPYTKIAQKIFSLYPPPPFYSFSVFLLAFFYFLVSDFLKTFYFKKRNKKLINFKVKS